MTNSIYILLYSLDTFFQIYFSAGVYLVGCVIYWFWVSGEVQPWARQSETLVINGDIEKNKKDFAFSNNGMEIDDEVKH